MGSQYHYSPKQAFPITIFSLTYQIQKQSPRVVLRNFTKFTGKHLCQSLFFNKVAGLGTGVL